MRKLRGRYGKRVGAAALALGIIIILALVMPAGFWFFALGAALVVAGIAILRCC